MTLERPELFDLRTLLLFLGLCLCLLLFSLGREYRAYRDLTRFNDAVIEAEVVDQYLKRKERRAYYVLKLKSRDGALFYTTASEHLRNLLGYRLRLRVRTMGIGFREYLGGFFAYSDILRVESNRSARIRLAEGIKMHHSDAEEGQLYAALFTASPMSRELRQKLSALGISHLLAISGFHLGVLSLIGFVLLAPLFTVVQSRWFPYVNRRRELFVIVAVMLTGYLLFLDYVPSLLRAYAMLVIGYWLYDRGIKVVSMQTLGIAVALLLALWPRLGFSLGFWLSIAGVYFILLFLRHFSHWHRGVQFAAIHVWVYLMMLPLSLYLFESFSLLHPASVVLSMLFILFYPLALLAHVIGLESLLDGILPLLLRAPDVSSVSIGAEVLMLQLALALGAFYRRGVLWLLLGVTLCVFVGAVYQVA